jgi:hypothetical protein
VVSGLFLLVGVPLLFLPGGLPFALVLIGIAALGVHVGVALGALAERIEAPGTQADQGQRKTGVQPPG